MNVSGQALMSFVKETKKYLADNLELPPGYTIEFDGNTRIRFVQQINFLGWYHLLS